MDEMELIAWITRLKEEIKALKETITVLEDVNDDLRWEIERLQKLIDKLPVELTPRDDARTIKLSELSDDPDTSF